MTTPTSHEKYAAIARAKGQSCTPYRLGLAVGKAGADLPSPYAPGSRGERNYRDGLEYGRAGREIDAKAQELYEASTAGDSRFPSWAVLTGAPRWQWRERAIAALASSTVPHGVQTTEGKSHDE